MQAQDIKIRSSHGGEFDCDSVTPDGNKKVPAMVLASAVHGVDKDTRDFSMGRALSILETLRA
jgi:hypothetical protein